RGARHMRLTKAISDYLDDLRRSRHSPATLRTYENSLGFLGRLAALRKQDEVGRFTADLVNAYFDGAGEERRNATATLAKKASALRGFARWGLKQRLWVDDPSLHVPKYRRSERLPKPYEPEDRDRLLGMHLEPSERALRAVLYHAGLRAGEVLS